MSELCPLCKQGCVLARRTETAVILPFPKSPPPVERMTDAQLIALFTELFPWMTQPGLEFDIPEGAA